MACTPALACKALLSQATARWPRRSRASDGICPSAAHTTANPTSDHELGNAGDLTHDPANGCDAHRWARLLADRRDRRVKYIISNGQIWNPLIAARAVYSALRIEGASVVRSLAAAAPGWRTYTGSNPHKTHAHVSIYAAYRNDSSPWFIDLPPAPTPTPPASYPEDAMVRFDFFSPLDDQGNGYIDVPIVAADIVSIVPNGDDPSGPAGDAGYKPVPRFSRLAWGAGARIVVVGGPPRGGVDFTVWTAA